MKSVSFQFACFLLLSMLPLTAVSRPEPVIVDNVEAVFEGNWVVGNSSTGKYGNDYQYSFCVAGAPTAVGIYRPALPQSGAYDVEIFFPPRATRSSDTPWVIFFDGGSVTSRVDQASLGAKWIKIGEALDFTEGTNGYVMISNNTSDAGQKGNGQSHVVADAVRFVPVPSKMPSGAARFIESFRPKGTNASPSPTVEITLRDTGADVDSQSIRLSVDDREGVPVVERQPQMTRVLYEFPSLLEPGSQHRVSLNFADHSPSPQANSFSYLFTVSEMVRVSK